MPYYQCLPKEAGVFYGPNQNFELGQEERLRRVEIQARRDRATSAIYAHSKGMDQWQRNALAGKALGILVLDWRVLATRELEIFGEFLKEETNEG